MSEEKTRSSGEQIGTLCGCLIEGDSEQKARGRKVKRRALTASVGLQSAAIVALVLVPLLGRTEKLPFTIVTPMPPYHAPRVHSEAHPQPPPLGGRKVCLVCFNSPLTPTPVTTDPHRFIANLTDEGIDIGVPRGSSEPTAPDLFNSRSGPVAPDDPDKNKKKRISVRNTVQQAMLVHRVEPVYPPIARTLHKSGQVHIRALISVDGSIDSLQVIDGDPLLARSALDAVGQWRYRPTTLNGAPVEVETIITVIYTLNQ